MALRIRRNAFTMVEVMVALVIGVMLLGIMYAIFSGSTKIGAKAETRNEVALSANLATECLKRDLKELVSLPTVPGQPRFGDYRNPVFITPDGKQISFYVPMKGDARMSPAGKILVQPLNYRLLPCGEKKLEGAGLNYFVRSQYKNGDEPEEVASAATGLKHVVGAVYLKDISFKLLSPYDDRPGYKSPDPRMFFVQVDLIASDSAPVNLNPKAPIKKEYLELRELIALDQPSQMAQIPNVGISQSTTYEPTGNLRVGPRLVSLTPPETEAVNTLGKLKERYEQGEIKPEELEKQVRDILKPLMGPNGTPILVGPNNPPDPTTLKVDPQNPGTLKGPGGETVVLPNPPAPAPANPAPPAASNPTPPAPVPTNGNGTWWVSGSKWAKKWEYDPATGQMKLVEDKSSQGALNGGFTVDNGAAVDPNKVQELIQSNINNGLTQIGFPPGSAQPQ